ncbi:MAG: inositol monophosphatase family protein [Candidatus Puniceispirillaceae bacterium]
MISAQETDEQEVAEQGLIDTVAQLMIQASVEIIMPRYQNLSADDIATKTADTDYVTIADREAEFWLIPRLNKCLDGVFTVGEESISDDPKLAGKIGQNLAFVIDPIDGTRNFVDGSPHFCSMISLIDHGEPLIAWVYRPIDGDITVAISGEGAYHMILDDDHNITDWEPVSRHFMRKSLTDMIGTGGIKGLSGQRREAVRNQLRALTKRRLIGSAGCEAVLIALGEHDYLMHSKTTAWDHTPVDLIARESGALSLSLPHAHRFSPLRDDAILIAPDEESWYALATHIWPEQAQKPS